MPQQLKRTRCAVGTWVGTAEKGAVLAGKDLLIFAFFFAFGTVSCLILLSSMKK
jgi:hypothetical protein